MTSGVWLGPEEVVLRATVVAIAADIIDAKEGR
jgi:hypothetical protein